VRPALGFVQTRSPERRYGACPLGTTSTSARGECSSSREAALQLAHSSPPDRRGDVVGLRRGRTTVVRRDPGDDPRTGRGGWGPLCLDRVPLSSTRVAATSHPSSGRELHRHRRSSHGRCRRPALRAGDWRRGHGPHRGPAHVSRGQRDGASPGAQHARRARTVRARWRLPSNRSHPAPGTRTSPIRRRARSDLSSARPDQRRSTPDARRLILFARCESDDVCSRDGQACP
jgi:hypothetical protein